MVTSHRGGDSLPGVVDERHGRPGPRPSTPPRTTLGALAAWLGERTPATLTGDPDTEVTGLTLSTARVRPGDLYVALPGSRVHGADHVGAALEAGATAVLTDDEGARRLDPG